MRNGLILAIIAIGLGGIIPAMADQISPGEGNIGLDSELALNNFPMGADGNIDILEMGGAGSEGIFVCAKKDNPFEPDDSI
jgi:hypothetical protein